MTTTTNGTRPFVDDTKIGDASAQQPLSGTAFVTGSMLVHGTGHGAHVSNEDSGKVKKQSQG